MERRRHPIVVARARDLRSRIAAMIGSAPSGRLQPDPSTQEPARDFDPEEGRAILRALFAQYRVKLMMFLLASFAQTDDLFESHSHIPDGDV